VERISDVGGNLPLVIFKDCRTCGAPLRWNLQGVSNQEVGYQQFGTSLRVYRCRNCTNGATFAFKWTATEQGGEFVKFGEMPPPDRRPPKELRANLQPDDLDFYTKALDCRHFNYGLAALGYMRRVIENRIDDILDLAYKAAEAEKIAAPDLGELEADSSPTNWISQKS
jgi:hypothetical protein